jgi:predicted nucleic acid-binding protein
MTFSRHGNKAKFRRCARVRVGVMLLLDTSFLIALSAEEDRRQAGAAVAFLRANPGQQTVVSLVAVGEYLEAVKDVADALRFLRRHTLIGLSMAIARKGAELQSRLGQRLGENDAWLAATALAHGFTLVTADHDFARVPRLSYVEFMKAA